MSTISEKLNVAWTSIKEDIGTPSGLYSRRIPLEPGSDIFAVISACNEMPELYFETPPHNIRKIKLERTCRGFEVAVRLEKNSLGNRVAKINVALTRWAFSDLFLSMSVDLVEQYCRASNAEEAINVLHSRLEHWSRFAELAKEGGLSEGEQIGLFGELVFLRRLLELGISGTSAVNSWHGPERKNQDFVMAGAAVEVKASTSNTPDRVRINSARQLDETGLDELYLFHAVLDRREGNGESLPNMVSEIARHLESLADHSALEFEDKLRLLGYHNTHAGQYEDQGFTIRNTRIFRVTGDFPRLTESQLPNGVSDTRYVVDLASAAIYEIDIDETLKKLRGILDV